MTELRQLTDLKLKRSYRSLKSNIAADFLIPALTCSRAYDRAAGYFTAGSIKILLTGFQAFASRAGRMRLIVSPELTDDDLQQITAGYASRELAIEARVNIELQALMADDLVAGASLAWLIANQILEIRFACPAGSRAGIYHEKFGIFDDNTGAVAFTGSLNETAAALSRNIEYIDVYASWQEPERVQEKKADFERLWEGTAEGVITADFPQACKDKLFKILPREYPLDDLLDHTVSDRSQLRPRQQAAIDAWTANGQHGLLAMATGTGKTITALVATAKLIQENVRTVVILVPQIALANQWAVEAERELQLQVLVCHSATDWRLKAKTAVLLAQTDKLRVTVIVSTYDTAQSDEFGAIVEKLPTERLLVADEVHNVSAEIASSVLVNAYSKRLGLSATPERWMDEDGNEALSKYFSGVVYRYSLAEAIADGTLTRYIYFPIICDSRDAELTDEKLPLASNSRASKFMRMFRESEGFQSAFSLVYCNHYVITQVLSYLGNELRLPVHTFTAAESSDERREILYQFGTGELHSLVAMGCLDEGIDVPATRSAYLLASSVNPKQFVQRRGRVLRRFPGKEFATIYDFLYLDKVTSETSRLRVQNEVNRFAEFASVAENSTTAIETLRTAGKALGINLSQFFQGV